MTVLIARNITCAKALKLYVVNIRQELELGPHQWFLAEPAPPPTLANVVSYLQLRLAYRVLSL